MLTFEPVEGEQRQSIRGCLTEAHPDNTPTPTLKACCRSVAWSPAPGVLLVNGNLPCPSKGTIVEKFLTCTYLACNGETQYSERLYVNVPRAKDLRLWMTYVLGESKREVVHGT